MISPSGIILGDADMRKLRLNGELITKTGVIVEYIIEAGRSPSRCDPGYGPNVEIGNVTCRGRKIGNIGSRNIERLRDMAFDDACINLSE